MSIPYLLVLVRLSDQRRVDREVVGTCQLRQPRPWGGVDDEVRANLRMFVAVAFADSTPICTQGSVSISTRA